VRRFALLRSSAAGAAAGNRAGAESAFAFGGSGRKARGIACHRSSWRTTPRGTVIGFLQAAQSTHLESAAQYFQQTRARHPANQDELVTQLKALMDRAYVGNINRITDLPEERHRKG